MKRDVAEKEINIIDMFWFVCLKWRLMLVCAIIFGILAGGLSYMKNANSAKTTNEETVVVSLEELEKDLSLESKGKVNAYIDYMEMFEKQSQYNENAFRMQLDANGYYRNVLSYYVDNHYTVEYPLVNKVDNINAILEAYTAQINGMDLTDKFKENLKIDEEFYPYVQELIECKIDKNTSEPNAVGGILTISISGLDKEMCDAVSNVVKDAMNSGKIGITQQVGEHDLVLLKDICIFKADPELLTYQKQNVEKLVSISTAMKNLDKDFTDEERACVSAYKSNEDGEAADGTKASEEVSVKATVSKKMILLGALFGVFLVAGVAAFMYLINNRIRLEDEFENTYGVKLLGNVIVKKVDKKKMFGFLDDFINKFRHMNKHYFEEEEAISMVAAGIKIGAKKLEISKAYITGAAMGEQEKAVVKKLKKELEKSNIEVIEGRPILYDAEALEKSAEIGCVVLIERAGVSLYNEVSEEIEVCAHQGTKVLGAVIVA